MSGRSASPRGTVERHGTRRSPSAPRDEVVGSYAVSDREFELFQQLVHREAGIWLAPVKRALLAGRLSRRLRELGLSSFMAYYERVESDAVERVRMFDCITTNETHFFREPRHFEFLNEEVFPRWREAAAGGRRSRRVRIWSAACSTGEEPYSLAMSFLRAFPPGSGWELEIRASDLSSTVLERAREALWPLEKSREIPESDLKAFMLRGVGSQEGVMKAGPEIRSVVKFDRMNLNESAYPPGLGEFDLVFCRNVLIYFNPDTKVQVVQRLLDHLHPEGYLFLGHAESLSGTQLQVRSVFPTVYAHLASSTAKPRSSP